MTNQDSFSKNPLTLNSVYLDAFLLYFRSIGWLVLFAFVLFVAFVFLSIPMVLLTMIPLIGWIINVFIGLLIMAYLGGGFYFFLNNSYHRKGKFKDLFAGHRVFNESFSFILLFFLGSILIYMVPIIMTMYKVFYGGLDKDFVNQGVMPMFDHMSLVLVTSVAFVLFSVFATANFFSMDLIVNSGYTALEAMNMSRKIVVESIWFMLVIVAINGGMVWLGNLFVSYVSLDNNKSLLTQWGPVTNMIINFTLLVLVYPFIHCVSHVIYQRLLNKDGIDLKKE